jgi:hypothetical protein
LHQCLPRILIITAKENQLAPSVLASRVPAQRGTYCRWGEHDDEHGFAVTDIGGISSHGRTPWKTRPRPATAKLRHLDAAEKNIFVAAVWWPGQVPRGLAGKLARHGALEVGSMVDSDVDARLSEPV